MTKKREKLNKVQEADVEAQLSPEDFQIQDPRKFTWTEEDVPHLTWLDDHEYTGTVPPSS